MSVRQLRPTPLRFLRAVVATGALAAVLATPALADAAEPLAAAHWQLDASPAPTNLPLEGEAMITDTASNIGDANVAGENETVTFTDRLPAGMEVTEIRAIPSEPPRPKQQFHVSCSAAGVNPVKCTFKEALAPYEYVQLRIRVRTLYPSVPSASQTENEFSVEGGEAPTASPLVSQLKVNGQSTDFGLEKYELTAENEDFTPDTQAGSHPFQMTTTLNLNAGFEHEHNIADNELLPSAPGALLKNLNVKLPPGLLGNANVIGNPNAVQQCSEANFGANEPGERNACPADTAIGVATVTVNDPIAIFYITKVVPVFNLRPAPGEPARFGFIIRHAPVILDTSVRTGEDYGATVSVHYSSQAVQVLGSTVTFWGVPGDPRHDNVRGWACLFGRENGTPCVSQKTAEPSPFLLLPTTCGSLSSSVSGDAWNPGVLEGEGKPSTFEGTFESPPQDALSGCEGLPFNPSLAVRTDTHAASTPTGMTLEVSMPQESTLKAGQLAEADVHSTTVELPEGLQTSAGAANGLETCQDFQAGFEHPDTDTGPTLQGDLEDQHFTSFAAACPDAAKLGTVDVTTPLLPEHLTGSLYLAEQNTNPFASPLVIYLIAEEKTSKVLVKLAGEVEINPSTGRLITRFKNTPQTPFSNLTAHLFNTERASQATPAFCGSYPASASFSPWSGAAAQRQSDPKDFEITSGPKGEPCPGATLPFAPGFHAGATNGNAGEYSPFELTINRPDGQQALESIDVRLPEGMAAKIASLTPCPAAVVEALPTLSQSKPACAPESLIGKTITSSGLGGAPVTLAGELFLTEGVDGAPFGLLAVTHAAAGPFDLGYVSVLSTITIDQTTAAVTVKSINPIPKILKGVPVQLKQINVAVDRPEFQFNPTSCAAASISGGLSGWEGASNAVSYPFATSNCARLPFAPKLTATVQGNASKANGTTFAVTVESPGIGQANIHKVDLTLPEALPSRLTTIQKACLEVVFNANPAACDEGSVIGEGIVHTPVLKSPLRGPAYLVSHGGAAFPDVEFVLQGERITLVLDGKTDIKKGITYSRFETTPDAPFTKFESIFPAGPHSALTANVPESENFNLCKHTLTMPTEITAHNGAFLGQTTPIQLLGCGGVAGFTTAKVKIKKHSVKGSTLTLVVVAPSAGRIAVGGSGLHTLKKSLSKLGTYKLKVKLGPKGKAAVAHKHLLKVHVRVSFAPTHGRASSAAVTVKFH